MSKSTNGMSYAEYKKAHGMTSKTNKEQIPDGAITVRQALHIALVAIILGVMAFSNITLATFERVVEPRDTASEIIAEISTQAAQEHHLSRVLTSGFSDMEVNQDWLILYPGDTIKGEIRVSPLGVIFKTGVIEYHLVRKTTSQP